MIRALKWSLAAWAVISLAIALDDVVLGGFYFTVAGLRISSFEAYKPFRNGMMCACAAFWLNDRDAGSISSWARVRQLSLPLAAAAAAAFVALAVHFGIFVAGGSDAWGYVSQAALWSSGTLIVPEPLAPIGRAVGVVTAPLGYRPAQIPGASVPTYSVGYPLMMTVASKLAGDAAIYYVVPLCGGAVVLLTFALGARFAGRRTGLVAALLTGCSPILLFQSLEPMSDVPVTMWFVLAWWLILGESTGAAAAAGLATAAAILTRPNLAPLALVLLAVAARRQPRLHRAAAYALATLPGAVAVAAINRHLYGTVSMSGYGSLGDIYDWRNFVPNLQRYPLWLVQLHTPAILAALAMPFAARREPDATGAIGDTRRVAFWMMVFSIALLLSYLVYGVFEEWPYVRFLLPAIPVLLVLTSNGLLTVTERIPLAFRTALLFVVVVLFGIWSFRKSDALGVYAVGFGERRYEAVGRYIDKHLPQNAAVITVIQSGSIRLYGHRPTLRWDELPAEKLDATIDALRTHGYEPYLLLEDWEEPMFRARFTPGNEFGGLDWPPALVCPGSITVRVYGAGDRSRYFAGARWVPLVIPRS